jgi:hypothetical protein
MKKEKYVELKGKSYPCRVTMGAMVRYKRATGTDVSKMVSNDVASIVEFMYYCVVSACNADGIEFEMDFETFADQLEPDGVKSFYNEVQEDSKKKGQPEMK